MDKVVPFNTSPTTVDISSTSNEWKDIIKLAPDTLTYKHATADGIVYSMRVLVPNSMNHVRVLEYPYYVWKTPEGRIRAVICGGETFYAIEANVSSAHVTETTKPEAPNPPIPTDPIPYEDLSSYVKNEDSAVGLFYYRVGVTFTGRFCDPTHGGFKMLPYWAAFLNIINMHELDGRIGVIETIRIPFTEKPSVKLKGFVAGLGITPLPLPALIPIIFVNGLGTINAPSIATACTATITEIMPESDLFPPIPVTGYTCGPNGREKVECKNEAIVKYTWTPTNLKYENENIYEPIKYSTKKAVLSGITVTCAEFVMKDNAKEDHFTTAYFIKGEYSQQGIPWDLLLNQPKQVNGYANLNGDVMILRNGAPPITGYKFNPKVDLPFTYLTPPIAIPATGNTNVDFTTVYPFQRKYALPEGKTIPSDIIDTSPSYGGYYFESYYRYSDSTDLYWAAPKIDKVIYCHVIYDMKKIGSFWYLIVVFGEVYTLIRVHESYINEDEFDLQTFKSGYSRDFLVPKSRDRPISSLNDLKYTSGYVSVTTHSATNSWTMWNNRVNDSTIASTGFPHWMSIFKIYSKSGYFIMKSGTNEISQDYLDDFKEPFEISKEVFLSGKGDVLAEVAKSTWTNPTAPKPEKIRSISDTDTWIEMSLFPINGLLDGKKYGTNWYKFIPDCSPEQRVLRNFHNDYFTIPTQIVQCVGHDPVPIKTIITCDDTPITYSEPLAHTPSFYSAPKATLWGEIKLPKQVYLDDKCVDTIANLSKLEVIKEPIVQASYHGTLVKPFDYNFVTKKAKTKATYFNYKGIPTKTDG